jgi:uncharacterized membrane protein
MKFLSILFLLCSSFGFGQTVKFLNQDQVQKLDLSKVIYVNGSNQKEADFDAGKDVFVDFQMIDVSSEIDEIVVEINKKKFSNPEIQPFLIKNFEGGNLFKVKAFSNGKEIGFHSKKGKGIKINIHSNPEPSIVKDTIVFGLLAVLLALIFYTSALPNKYLKKFYTFIPALLLCYLFPAILNSMGLISNEYSGVYTMTKNYLLPAALVLMTLGIDFKGLINLGPKAIIMFLTATVGIILGGPVAILVFKAIDPSIVDGIGNDATWRGLATLAGSWIGGGANQAAMLETYHYNQDLYGKMVTVDIVVANMWMAFLLWAATRSEKFDKWLKADSSAIEDLKERTMNYQSSINRTPSLTDYMMILGIAFGAVALAHFFGEDFASFFENKLGEDSPFASGFFWIVVIATSVGLILSMTKLRNYEGAGASKIGSVFIYILVASIGMNMELAEAVKEPMLLLVGIVWMLFHILLLFAVAKIIKAPFFFVAVGSKANVGGAASAPVIAAAFHPSLASVGAILAVLGYALGTYGAIMAAELMKAVAPI